MLRGKRLIRSLYQLRTICGWRVGCLANRIPSLASGRRVFSADPT
jgi:hypothetical protein